MAIMAKIGEIWTSIISWIVSAITDLTEVFYDSTGGEFTFLGVLALIGLGIGIVFLEFIKTGCISCEAECRTA